MSLSISSSPSATRSAAPAPAPAPSTQRTCLQKHVDFFDRNHDGQITVGETYDGLRALGLGRGRAAVSALAINLGLGPSTSAHWYTPTTIDTSRIQFGKHGSDTGIIDANGNFVQAKFDEMFDKFDANKDGDLNEDEVKNMLTANRTDKVGHAASNAEFSLLMEIASEDKGGTRVLSRDRMASLYDGSLFYKVAGEKVP